jgi:tetratricopeptide (TPR) repeat protein
MKRRNKNPGKKRADLRASSPPTTGNPSTLNPQPSTFPTWLWAALLALATILAYLPVWHAGYIFDDDQYVTANPALRSLAGLGQIWFQPSVSPQYYPVVFTSFWLEYHFWGLNPMGYHVGNVLLHALAALLLWRVLVRLRLPGAWLAAAIFALHPVMVESVAWVTERKNVLSAVFYFATALAYWRWREPLAGAEKSGPVARRWYFIALGLFLAALLSKTAVCSLPAALLLVVWWQQGRVQGREVWPLLPFFAAAAGLALLTARLEQTQVGAAGPEWAIGFPERCVIAGRALWFYAGKLFWPEQLTFIYPRWPVGGGSGWLWLYPAAAVALVGGLWRLRRQLGRGPLVATLFFGGTLLPTLGFTNFYFTHYSFVADHFQYLAAVSVIVLAVAGLTWAVRRLGTARVAASWLGGGALLATLGVLTWQQAGLYQTPEIFWQTIIDRNPACWLAQHNLSGTLLQQGRVAEAIGHLQTVLALQPDSAEAHNNLGQVLLQTGRVDEGMYYLQKALTLQPDFAEAHDNLGDALAQKGKLDAAVSEFQKALALKPDLAQAHNNLGQALAKQGKVDGAIREFQTAVQIKPDFAEAQNNLGNALLQKGQLDEAISQFQKTVFLNPENAKASYNLGNALLQKGRVDDALIYLQKALALQPDDADAHNNLGNALFQKGRLDEAIRQFQKALALRPDDTEAGYNLGNALLQKGQLDEAIRQFKKVVTAKPDFTYAYNNLAVALLQKGQVDEAIRQFQKVLTLQQDNMEAQQDLAHIAWAMATSPDASMRNGTKAVELARQTDQLSGGKSPEMAATLAAAYAETGQFTEAVAAAQRAMRLAAGQNNPAMTGALKIQLEMYQAGMAFRDPGPTP